MGKLRDWWDRCRRRRTARGWAGERHLTPHQRREAIKRRDRGGESLAELATATTSAGRRFPG